MRYEFHSHTILGDGELLPIELIRRAYVLEHKAIAITEHVSIGNCERIIKEVKKECELAEKNWDIIAICGVEITHVPKKEIGKVVKMARKFGAELIVVHGETIVEPVEKGTNEIVLNNPEVDILAHPGFLTIDEGEKAKKNNIFIELSARKGHCLINGHVAKIGEITKVNFIVNTDAHSSNDLINNEFAIKIAMASGLNEEKAKKIVIENPKLVMKRIGR